MKDIDEIPSEPEWAEDYVEVCAVCGIALKKEDICMSFNGLVVDYVEKYAQPDDEFYLCATCRAKLKHNLNVEFNEAIKKRMLMDEDIKSQLKEQDKREKVIQK